MKKSQAEIERDEQLKTLLAELQHEKDSGNASNEELALLDLLILRLDSPIPVESIRVKLLEKAINIFEKKRAELIPTSGQRLVVAQVV